MTLSGWCMGHGRPDQWHDECELRGLVCGCPNHALNKGSGVPKRYTWGTSKDGPRPAALTAGSSQGLARRCKGAPN